MSRETAQVGTDGRRGIVVGIDASAASDAALAWACDEARLRGVALVVMHVVPVPWEVSRAPIDEPANKQERHGRQVLDEALARAPSDGVELQGRLVDGAPEELLLEASEDAELVVVGTRRHRGLTSFLVGSVANALVHDAHCPVVVVREGATSD
jgi:nucleotide-binding universal stress UspA family protein